MKNKLVSIIIPCYNADKYINETLDCLLKQTIEDWECIIVNDGSTDNSVSIISKYLLKDTRFKLINQNNSGPSIARNRGVELCVSKYIYFLDSDDIIESSYLEEALEYMESHPETILYYTNMDYFGAKNGIVNNNYTTYKDLLIKNSIPCCCILKRDDFLQFGGFDTSLKGLEDWEFFIRLLYHNDNIYKSEKILYHYRKYPETDISVNNEAFTKLKSLNSYIYEKHKSKYEEYWGTPYEVHAQCYRLSNKIHTIESSKGFKIYKLITSFIQKLKAFHI